MGIYLPMVQGDRNKTKKPTSFWHRVNGGIMLRDYERGMETFELKYEAWRESEYEKYCEKQYDLLHAPANIQQQVQPTTQEPINHK